MPEDQSPVGRMMAKLVATKEKWAREGRALTDHPTGTPPDRLPPGQHEVKNWPVLDLGVRPHIDLATWSLVVDGLVALPLVWDWTTFQAQPQIDDVSDIHCVTTWSRFDNQWRGVSARHLLAQVNPLPEAQFLVFHAYDGYTTNLPLSAFDDGDVLLAHSWNGAPLTIEHGGPVRVIVPKLYFWKSTKWINRIEFTVEDRLGFWEQRGYHAFGDPWSEQRYG